MKQFQYKLKTVPAYKPQVLDNLKVEHAALLQIVNRKKEIRILDRNLAGMEDNLDQTTEQGATIEDYRLFDMCIERIEAIIDEENERLKGLQKQEVISTKMDTSKFEKLKDKKYIEYQKTMAKIDEAFIEESVSNTARQFCYHRRG